MAMPDQFKTHSLMRLQAYGGMVVLQPYEEGGVVGRALTIDLQTGKLALGDAVDQIKVGFTTVYGIMGMVRLHTGCILIVATGAEQVATLRGCPVYKVTDTQTFGKWHLSSKQDDRFVELLEDGCDPGMFGQKLYFSYGTDITLTQQRWVSIYGDSRATNKPMWANADKRFWWNRFLAQTFTEAGGLDNFVLPMILGSIGQIRPLQFKTPDRHFGASITLIARRSLQRIGTRHWRRGADDQGSVANFVESEQLIVLEDKEGNFTTSSFVQIRGSIPLLWSQIPNIKYKPPTRIAPPSAYQPAFDRHFKSLLEAYQDVTAVNLINQHGSEGVLAKAFNEEALRFAETSRGLRLVAFDFHKQCGASKYHNLSLLWDQLKDDFQRDGFFREGSQADGQERQRGVVRTNCIDCLDRTNVVQGLLGRKHLEAVLDRAGLLDATDQLALPNTFPLVERKFKWMWADHGDDISRQYAGTGALKSGFTRTGKRTYWGLLDDGIKSGARYYLNNFSDGRKQDATDIVTGNYTITDKQATFHSLPSAWLPALVAINLWVWAFFNFIFIARGKVPGNQFVLTTQLILLPTLLGWTILYLVFKYGSKFINRPLLRPDLSQTWK